MGEMIGLDAASPGAEYARACLALRRKWQEVGRPLDLAEFLKDPHALMLHAECEAASVSVLQADNAALRAALSRLAACAFGPPGELMAAADAARELLGE